VDDVDRLARICRARWERFAQGGVLVCNPIPEADAIPDGALDHAIQRALADASSAGVAGTRLTPYLLAPLARATGGRAVAANRALARNNAMVAAGLAVALAAAA
jgi:pseudouridylate synthase